MAIMIRMSGGLGNQMFQYALGVALQKAGREVSFDDETEYRTTLDDGTVRERRPKLLETAFGIRYPKASKEELIAMTDSRMDPASRIRRKLTGRKTKAVYDSDFVFDESFLKRDSGYYCGCVQSEQYFASAKDEVRAAYTFTDQVISEVRENLVTSQMEVLIRSTASHLNAAAVHLRFGDYLDNQSKYGGICTNDYYDAAIAYLGSRFEGIRFFVFSNDSSRAKRWIAQRDCPDDFTLVEGSDEDHGYIDLYLMSLCNHFVMANSSFSYWGAWLGKAKDKCVVAPSFWTNQEDGSELQRCDIFTKEMVRINPSGEMVGNAAAPESTAQPLVSVIVAAYNIEDYLERCMDSLLGQTYKNLEIILVDDGSVDKTPAICDSYAEKDTRVRVIHKENGGLSSARNAGLNLATGRYIGFVDGDDWCEATMYETMVMGCIKADAPMACIKYQTVQSEKQETWKAASRSVEEDLRTATVLSQERALDVYVSNGLNGNEVPVIIFNSVWSKLFHRNLIEGMRFDTGRNSEDIMWTTKMLCRADKVCYIPAPLYCYLEDRAGSIMNVSLGERRLRDEIPFWHEHIRHLRDYGHSQAADKAQFYFYKRMMVYAAQMHAQSDLKPYADKIEAAMRGEQKQVLESIDHATFASKGDQKRLRMFVKNPAKYYRTASLYENTVVALRRSLHR